MTARADEHWIQNVDVFGFGDADFDVGHEPPRGTSVQTRPCLQLANTASQIADSWRTAMRKLILLPMLLLVCCVTEGNYVTKLGKVWWVRPDGRVREGRFRTSFQRSR